VDTIIYDIYHDRLTLTENLNNALMQEAQIQNALLELQVKRPYFVRQIAQLERLIEKYSKLFDSHVQTEMRIATEGSLGFSPAVKMMNLQMALAALDCRAWWQKVSAQTWFRHIRARCYGFFIVLI